MKLNFCSLSCLHCRLYSLLYVSGGLGDKQSLYILVPIIPTWRICADFIRLEPTNSFTCIVIVVILKICFSGATELTHINSRNSTNNRQMKRKYLKQHIFFARPPQFRIQEIDKPVWFFSGQYLFYDKVSANTGFSLVKSIHAKSG